MSTNNKPHLPTSEKASFSIDEFCARNDISRSMFYLLKKGGKAPRVMSVGTRQIITKEAESDWHRQMEGAPA